MTSSLETPERRATVNTLSLAQCYLILDFWPPELKENVSCFKALHCGNLLLQQQEIKTLSSQAWLFTLPYSFV